MNQKSKHITHGSRSRRLASGALQSGKEQEAKKRRVIDGFLCPFVLCDDLHVCFVMYSKLDVVCNASSQSGLNYLFLLDLLPALKLRDVLKTARHLKFAVAHLNSVV